MNRIRISALAAMALASAYPALASAEAAAPETVLGVASAFYDRDPALTWTPERFVRIRNSGGTPVTVQPPAREPVFLADANGHPTGFAYPWVYSVRTAGSPNPQVKIEAYGGSAFTLPAGDSADIGLFQIGQQAVPKRSAAGPLAAAEGDTVVLPVVIRYGSDSVRFMLKTVIANTVIGSGWVLGPKLFGDRDTVFGVEKSHWQIDPTWDRKHHIGVRNLGTRPLTLDSIRFRDDSVVYGGIGTRMMRLFATRTYAGGEKTTAIWSGDLKRFPVTLAPGEKADFGLFEVGTIGLLVKQSAAGAKYKVGDTLVAPVTIFAKEGDSVKFVLKAKVMSATAGSALRAPGRGPAGKGDAGTAAVAADGRRNGNAIGARGIRFRAPAAGTASRPR